MISFYNLKYFAEAAKWQSISEASKTLKITSSAISQAIKALEDEFQIPLILHKKNHFQLTEAGKLLSQKALPILASMNGLKNDLHSLSGELKGEFTFMTHQSIANTILPKFLKNFTKKFPKIKTNIKIGTREQIESELQRSEIDFALTTSQFSEKYFSFQKIQEGKFQLVSSRENEIITQSSEFILSDMNTNEITLLKKIFRKTFKENLNSIYHIKSWGVCKELAGQGLGIAFVPDYILEHKSSSKIYKLKWPFKHPEISYSINAIWQKKIQLCNCSQRFIKEFAL